MHKATTLHKAQCHAPSCTKCTKPPQHNTLPSCRLRLSPWPMSLNRFAESPPQFLFQTDFSRSVFQFCIWRSIIFSWWLMCPARHRRQAYKATGQSSNSLWKAEGSLCQSLQKHGINNNSNKGWKWMNWNLLEARSIQARMIQVRPSKCYRTHSSGSSVQTIISAPQKWPDFFRVGPCTSSDSFPKADFTPSWIIPILDHNYDPQNLKIQSWITFLFLTCSGLVIRIQDTEFRILDPYSLFYALLISAWVQKLQGMKVILNKTWTYKFWMDSG